MTAPKTESDGSEERGHEGHFDVSQQQPPKLEARVSLERRLTRLLCCHNNGPCWFLSRAEQEKRI